MKTSLEVEYWVVDDDGDLTSPDTLLDVSDRVVPEFVEPMLEIKTTPCDTMSELRAELTDRVRRVVDAARADGKRLVPLGTPLSAAPSEIPYRDKRGTNLQREIVGRQFDDARFCAGTHVHLEQDNVVDQLNALTAIDPAFALLNSASHYRGERILACARPYLYRRCCYEAFPEQGQLWPYVDSVEEWNERLRVAFEGFRETALERGVDPAVFDDEFEPSSAVWGPVRLRTAFPTVEWRSPDTALPSQALRLAGSVREFVTRANDQGTTVEPLEDGVTDAHEFADADALEAILHDDIDVGTIGAGVGATTERTYSYRGVAEPVSLPPFEAVERITDAAMRDGIANEDVRDYLRSLGFDPGRYHPLADRIPNGRLSRERARSLRLEAAAALEDDLARTPPRRRERGSANDLA